MSFIHSFPPIAGSDASILILGSMPGKASLQANQYYAHPRNAFWSIIEALFGIEKNLSYQTRCESLIQHQIAVWDVLKTCTRSSSLDSDIDESSIIPNDFQNFFSTHPKIQAVYFNGAMAEKTYLKRVLPVLPEVMANLATTRLPSTSPANASLNFQKKLEKWRVISVITT